MSSSGELRPSNHLGSPQTPASKASALTPIQFPLSKWKLCYFWPSLLAASAIAILGAAVAHAGGPKYVAGVSYFNPSVLGQPITWAGGQIRYFVDQGPLGPLSNAAAVSM